MKLIQLPPGPIIAPLLEGQDPKTRTRYSALGLVRIMVEQLPMQGSQELFARGRIVRALSKAKPEHFQLEDADHTVLVDIAQRFVFGFYADTLEDLIRAIVEAKEPPAVLAHQPGAKPRAQSE
jgi:hypothetical protein